MKEDMLSGFSPRPPTVVRSFGNIGGASLSSEEDFMNNANFKSLP